MLPRQNRRRHQDGALLAGGDALKRRAQGDLRLAEAHIAAQQSVHRRFTLHVVFNLVDAAQLVVRFVVFKVRLKIVLPFVVFGERKALLLHALSV